MNVINDLIYRACNRQRIYINAYVNRPGHTKFEKNWGDDINYWFLKEIIKKPIRLYNESPIAFRKNDVNYLVIGSTISLLTKANSIVWGAGCITDKKSLPERPKKVLAVRGPLTRHFLIEHNIDCPEIYGDPALLLPLFYKPAGIKKHKVGYIQHVSEKLNEIDGCHRISLSEYTKWTDVIDEISSCETIASSSLHGLIVAEAYGVPNVWVESTDLLGGHFKFHDFFASIKSYRESPIKIVPGINASDLYSNCVDSSAHNLNLKPLIDNCPFELLL